jgi:hypothetical protein
MPITNSGCRTALERFLSQPEALDWARIIKDSVERQGRANAIEKK